MQQVTNPARITPGHGRTETDHDRRLGETTAESQQDSQDDEGLEVAPRQSERSHKPTTNVTCDRNFNPATHQTHAQVPRSEKEASQNEEMTTLQ